MGFMLATYAKTKMTPDSLLKLPPWFNYRLPPRGGCYGLLVQAIAVNENYFKVIKLFFEYFRNFISITCHRSA